MLELFRKLVLAGGIMFVAPGSSGQIGFALIITLFFFAMHTMKKPYKHVLHDIVKGLSELVIFVVLLSCLMCKPALNIMQTSDMVTAMAVFTIATAVAIAIMTVFVAQKLIRELLAEINAQGTGPQMVNDMEVTVVNPMENDMEVTMIDEEIDRD